METISPYKSHIRNYPTKIISGDFNFPSNNFHTMGNSFFQAPPPFLSHHSYPPFSLHQPPLLPLSTAVHRRSAAACPPPNKKSNRIRKDEKSKKYPKAGNNIYRSSSNISFNNNNTNSLMRCVKAVELDDGIDKMYSGSVVCSVSPPPSSLPLPSFSVRPKLVSCHVEAAAGIDAGATDNLRRLLRLR